MSSVVIHLARGDQVVAAIAMELAQTIDLTEGNSAPGVIKSTEVKGPRSQHHRRSVRIVAGRRLGIGQLVVYRADRAG
ncbi:MAG TPA: hypothetical protein VNH38_02100 [Candidatus Dormibacteraeota bacterium]|nr:hypothetical protein [Candidatus Dormibacteraeota bacterium]